jgi:hypothetical protein
VRNTRQSGPRFLAVLLAVLFAAVIGGIGYVFST